MSETREELEGPAHEAKQQTATTWNMDGNTQDEVT